MRGSMLAFVALAFVAGTAACTLVSGVDEMELRKSPAASSAATADAGEGTNEGGGGSVTPPGSGTTNPPLTVTGPATCGAQGSWTTCDPSPTLTTCAERCQQQGLSCVDSCCANDELGDFAAQVGMVYAILELECSLKSVSASSKGGFCTDPTLLTATGATQVRCCCK